MTERKKYILLSVILAVIFLALIGVVFLNQPLKPTLDLEKFGGQVKVDSRFKIRFDWPVSRQVELSFKPELLGQISYEDNIYGDHLSRTLVFQPEYNLSPETTYQVKVTNVRNALPNFLGPREYSFSFTTESLPKIKEISPDEKKEINADTKIKVALDKTPDSLAAFEFIFQPHLEFQSAFDESKLTYTISPKDLLSQGQKYTFQVKRKNLRYFHRSEEVAFQSESEELANYAYQVREAPYLKSFSPQGNNVALNTPLAVVFNEKVNFDSFAQKVSIKPALAGAWQTEDGITFSFDPEDMAKETTYTVTIASGLKTEERGFFEEDAVHVFTSIGPVKLLSRSPQEGATGVDINANIRVAFDQPVDKNSASEHFSISPEVAGDFVWEENTLVFEPASPLAFNATYTVTLSRGIKGLGGFDSESDFSFSFSTELSVTKLQVAFHRQEHNLSCEVATLVMALSYRGVSVSEAELINKVGFDPTPKANGVWGNPHIGFVGDIDGRQPSTGYGVYWQPLAKAAQSYRSSRWFTGGNLADLLAEIKAGNPVIIWGTAGSGSRIDWKTPSGDNVVAINGEHTMLVIGYVGSANNPSKIIVLDPLSGERHFSAGSFMWNWGLLNRSGVVVE